jgi:hypothetical protein
LTNSAQNGSKKGIGVVEASFAEEVNLKIINGKIL